MDYKWLARLFAIAAVVVFILGITHQIDIDTTSAWMLGIFGSILLIGTMS